MYGAADEPELPAMVIANHLDMTRSSMRSMRQKGADERIRSLNNPCATKQAITVMMLQGEVRLEEEVPARQARAPRRAATAARKTYIELSDSASGSGNDDAASDSDSESD